MKMSTVELRIRPIHRDDFPDWERIYKQYLKFYKTDLSSEQLAIVWSWLFSVDQKMHCHVALHENKIIGLVHFREFLRPFTASTAIFMDDLYVENNFRGVGVAQSLIKSVRDFAFAQKISLVRWLTDHDNEVAMRVYDKLANKMQWQVYDMVVATK